MAEYLDRSYTTWRAFRESLPLEFGIIADRSAVVVSGSIPASRNTRGMALSQLAKEFSSNTRSSGIRVAVDGTLLILSIGPLPISTFQGLVASPLNVIEQSGQVAGSSPVARVTAEADGMTATVNDPSARVPISMFISAASGDTVASDAGTTLNANSRNIETVTLLAKLSQAGSGLAAMRPGDVFYYIRSDGDATFGVLMRCIGIAVDERQLPDRFVINAQTYEPHPDDPVSVKAGLYWPSSNFTGLRFLRRIDDLESR